MKTLLAAVAALTLIGGASAGDKDWTKATKAQLIETAQAMVGVYEGDDKEMGDDGAMIAKKSRVEISFADGTMTGRWDDGADGSWDGEWTETYMDGGYMMTDTQSGDQEIMVASYVADRKDATHFSLKDKWTSVWRDGVTYDYVAYMTVDGDRGSRSMKVRPAGSDEEWTTVFETEFTRVDGAS